MKLPDKVYDILKWIAIIALPALAPFVRGMCAVWNLPYGDQIGDTIMLLNSLLGALICVSTVGYQRSVSQMK